MHEVVEHWYLDLCRDDPATADGIADAIEQLVTVGPALGRPLVDRIHGSRHHNMKELRPPSTGGSQVRLLFAFDPEREAVFLVAGDKSGRWASWYREAVPLADKPFDQHLEALRTQQQGSKRHGTSQQREGQ